MPKKSITTAAGMIHLKEAELRIKNYKFKIQQAETVIAEIITNQLQ